MKATIIVTAISLLFVTGSLHVVNAQNNTEIEDTIPKRKIPFIPENKDDKTMSSYFFVFSNDSTQARLPLEKTTANVLISGVIADVSVKQHYINTGDSTLEAVYIFPASTRAAVYAMNMKIGDRIVYAKIKEKEQARTEYQQALQEGQTASLLEQHRPNVFQMNVGNIRPGDTIIVEMSYTELIEPQNDIYEFVFPATVGARYSETGEDWNESQPFVPLNITAQINAGMPIESVRCASHKTEISNKNGVAVVEMQTKSKDENVDFVLKYSLKGKAVQSGLLLHEHDDENFFLLMMQPPETPDSTQIPPREYVFIIDVSGSMSGFPLDVSKKLIREMISNLRPVDRFNVMLFEASNSMLYETSVMANDSNIRKAIETIDKHEAGGGTRILPALQKALDFKGTENYSRSFIVVTDGYIVVEQEAFKLIRDNLNKANLFAFGIGRSCNRYLIEGMAYAGQGEPYFITNKKEALLYGTKFKEYIEKPVLTNIEVDYLNFEAYDTEPVSIPDVFSKRPVLLYGKYRGTPTGNITIKGLSGNNTYSQTFRVEDVSNRNNPALRYLWARNRIKYISDYSKHFGGIENPQSEVTALGLKYNLLTEYTSFIAVDSLIRDNKQDTTKTEPFDLEAGFDNPVIAARTENNQIRVRGTKSYSSKRYFSRSNSVRYARRPSGSNSLDEVVVTAFGVARRKKALSYSHTVVATDDMSTASNPLACVASGVNVVSNQGDSQIIPGIIINGLSSVVYNSPLIVVDGVPYENQTGLHTLSVAPGISAHVLQNISSFDVYRIEILKDATTTALYGAKAANGVINISSKNRNRQRRTGKIEFQSKFTVSNANRLPVMQNQFAQGQRINVETVWRGAHQMEAYSWGPAIKNLQFDGNNFKYDKNGMLENNDGTGKKALAYNAYDIFHKQLGWSNHLAFSGDRKTKYRLAFTNEMQNGIVPETGSTKNIVSAFVSHRFDYLSLEAAANYGGSKITKPHQYGIISGLMRGILLTPPTFDNANGITEKPAETPSTYSFDDGTHRSFCPHYVDNPYFVLIRNKAETKGNTILATAGAKYDWDAVTFHYNYSYKFDNLNYTGGLDRFSSLYLNGILLNREERNDNHLSKFAVRYFKDDIISYWSLKTSLNYIYKSDNKTIERTDGANLLEQGDFSAENAINLNNNSFEHSEKRNALSWSFNTDYRSIFFVGFNIYSETSNWRPENIKNTNAYSSGFSFVPSQIRGFNNHVLNFLKFKFNFSNSDNAPLAFVNPYLYIAQNYDYTKHPVYYEKVQTKLPDNLKKEKIISFTYGSEIILFNNKIKLTADYIASKNKNIYYPFFTSDKLAIMQNGGDVKNNSINIDLNLRTGQSGAFIYKSAIRYSKNTSEVISMPQGVDVIAIAGFKSMQSVMTEGKPFPVFYGTQYVRNSNGEIIVNDSGHPLQSSEMGVIGNPNAKFNLGWNNKFHYKNFQLTVDIDYKHGGDVWNGTKTIMNKYGTSQESAEIRKETNFVFDGVKTNGAPNDIPIDMSTDGMHYFMQNDWFGIAEAAIEDGTWLRLQTVELSYTWKNSWRVLRSRNNKLKSIKFSVFANNLLLYTPYSGVDPQTSLTYDSNGIGLDLFNFPAVRSVGCVLRFKF